MQPTLKALTMCLGLLLTLNAHAQRSCGQQELHQYYLLADPAYPARLKQVEVQAQQYFAQGAPRQRVVVTIPVVVHVVHNGEAVGVGRNISDAQVLSQIEVLNEDYRFRNADASLIPSAFQPLAADFEIEFCLAIRDPNGLATTGIERINGNKASWLMSEIETDLKPVTIWNPDQYLNIWTVQMGGANAGTLGYATKPGLDPNVDGVVVQYKYFGRVGTLTAPFNKGRTCTHEVGHYLGLDHLWGLGEPNVSACGDDDGISDTPVQEKANYNCPSFPKTSCSNGPNGDMFMNYMDYVNDACMFMFSTGQKNRVASILNTARASLLTSTACTRYNLDAGLLQVVHPQTTVCENTLRVVVLVRNEGSQTITRLLVNNVVDQSSFNQKQWTGNLPSGQSTYIALDPITLTDGPHELNVYISNPNNGVDQLVSNNSIDLNITVTGQQGIISLPTPFSEGFEGASFPPIYWESLSSGGVSGAWTLYSLGGGFGTSFQSVRANFFASNTSGQKQTLLSPYFTIPVGQTAALGFSYAYTRKDSLTNDSLKVYYSLDCGSNWNLLWSRSGVQLQTAPVQNIDFVPTASDWAIVRNLNLGATEGQNRLRLKFEAVSNNGNNIYLDDINLDYFTVGIREQEPTLGLILYPNPAQRQVLLQASGLQGTVELQVFDLQGKLLINNNVLLDGNPYRFDISMLKGGLYMVKIATHDGDRYAKLVVE